MTNDRQPSDTTSEQTVFGWPQSVYDQFDGVEPQPVMLDHAQACPVRQVGKRQLHFLGMADVRAVLKHEAARSTLAPTGVLGASRPLIPLQLERPEHTAYRKLLDPHFSASRMALLEPDVRELADELIDGFVDDGEVELYDRFCDILPGTIFARIMGIPDEDIPWFMAYKHELLRGATSDDPAEEQARQAEVGKRCYAYFDELFAAREASSVERDDLVGRLMSTEVDGHRLSREDLLDITYVLIIAGLDTVAGSLSSFFSWLARHPDERRRAVTDPSMWPRVVEELLRWETPVPVDLRFSAAPMDINGTEVPAGRALTVSLAAANLDPAVFPDPLRVDFDRPSIPHASFAMGIHRCLGSHLARMELRVVLEQFHRRIPEYRIAPGAELRYERGLLRMVRPLPIVWD